MIYSNDDPMAIYAMESERTGDYGDYDVQNKTFRICPVCGIHQPDYYYVDENKECIGCSECVYRTEEL